MRLQQHCVALLRVHAQSKQPSANGSAEQQTVCWAFWCLVCTSRGTPRWGRVSGKKKPPPPILARDPARKTWCISERARAELFEKSCEKSSKRKNVKGKSCHREANGAISSIKIKGSPRNRCPTKRTKAREFVVWFPWPVPRECSCKRAGALHHDTWEC